MATECSDRLMAVLRREIDDLHDGLKENDPETGHAPADGLGAAGESGRRRRPGAKERIDALGQLTRTLEKLLELKRLEGIAVQGEAAGEAETARLRAELLDRLRSLDARRRAGPTLFDPLTGAFHGDPAPLHEVGDGSGGADAIDGAARRGMTCDA